MKKVYDASSIQILEGLKAVQKRPGMFIGDTEDGTGLHHMCFEVVDNAIDEALAGFCNEIIVTLNPNNSITVADNGRGIPTGLHKSGESAAQVILTTLHAGAKFGDGSYSTSGGLHGVGVSVVNALSESLQLDIYRNGYHYSQTYANGVPSGPLLRNEKSEKTGTVVQFLPSGKYFKILEYDTQVLEKRLRELAFLNPQVKIVFNDARLDVSKVFHYQGGLIQFVEFLGEGKKLLHERSFCCKGADQFGASVEIVLQWSENFYPDRILYYTNMIPQTDGGSHATGLKNGLSRGLRKYLTADTNMTKILKGVEFLGEDIREGVFGICLLLMKDPKFSSQTKEKLVSSDIRPLVDSTVADSLYSFLLENPKDANQILTKIAQAARARVAAREARKKARLATNRLSEIALPGVLADCTNRQNSELFLVEGASAGGSATQGRRREFQAVLALRGKVLNAERACFNRLISFDAISNLVLALGGEVEESQVQIKNLRYERVVIMTDADVDGLHIRTLLLVFFFRYTPKLISDGRIFVAQPPLYKIKYGKIEKYLKDDKELEEFLLQVATTDSYLLSENSGRKILGKELEQLMTIYQSVQTEIYKKKSIYPSKVLEELITLPAINEENLKERAFLEDWLERFRNSHFLRQLTGSKNEFSLLTTEAESFSIAIQFSTIEGSEEKLVLDASFFKADLYQKIKECGKIIVSLFPQGGLVHRGNNEKPIKNFSEAYQWLQGEARAACSWQRYKGLGEMNPEQLAETTMDPENRRFIRVTIKDAEDADRTFSILMGDKVPPRRQFIINNAKDVDWSNIDF